MKLKKLLAAVTAAALAVTTMAVTSFTASAEDEFEAHTIYQYVAGAAPAEYTIERSDSVNWSEATSIAIRVYGTKNADAEWFNFYVNETTDYYTADTQPTDSGTYKELVIDSDVDAKKENDVVTGGALAKFKAASGIKLGLQNYGTLSKISIIIDDGSEITVYDGSSAPNGRVFNSDGGTVEISASDLSSYGVTADNIASCSVKVQYAEAPTDAACGIFVINDWSGSIAYKSNIASEEVVVDFTATKAADAISNGVMIQLKDCIVTKITLNVPASQGGGSEGGEGGDTPTPPPAGGSALWEGTQVMTWDDHIKITADKFTSVNAGDTIKVTFTPADGSVLKFATNSDGWPVLDDSSKADPTYSEQWGTVVASTSPYSLVIAGGDVEVLKATGLIIQGDAVTVTKVELISAGGDEEHTHTGGTATCQAKAVCTVCGLEYGELAAHTYSGGVCTVCGAADPSAGSGSGSGSGSTPSAPSTSSSSTSVSQTTIIDKILATPDGGNSSVNLGSSTKVDKLAIEAIATKGDVTIKLNVAGGAYWEINGKNVTDAKDVNLGVKVNSKQIPASKVEDFAGEKTTVQLSLSHNGDFGFTGTLNVPVGSANNGKFANLYYYHGGKFDFVGSSPIKGGRTQFAFSHASNYLIVIDDYAYGEDVSSAAGMTETTETDAFPYVAVLVVISAFGASAIVLKKRLSK